MRKPAQHRLVAVIVLPLILVSLGCLAPAQAIGRDVPYVPTPQPVVEKMLQMADVKPSDMMYDLGCGDGRIVITAARQYGARGVGIDIDPQRIAESRQNAQQANVADRVTFVQQSLFDADIKDASVVTLYLLSSVNLKLRPRLLSELKPGTRVVSHAFDMGDWRPDATAEVEGRDIYFWVIPAHVQGRWQGTLQTPQGPQPATLQLQQKHQFVTGTAQFGDRQLAIQDGRLNGEQLTFTIASDGQQSPSRYTCRVERDQIQGSSQAQANGQSSQLQLARR